MYLRLLAILLFLLIPACCIPCPLNCSCSTATFSCQVCLEYYLQVYSLETKGCECLPGFILTDEVVDYCHPYNCKKSNDWGCATCYPHAQIVYDNTYQFYNCSCVQNYYLNLTTYLCRCMSLKEPAAYYEDTILDQCYACPDKCNCNANGCVSCASDSMREIVTNVYSSTCYCKYPHLDVNGDCKCAQNCTCSQDGTTTCDDDSNRQQILGRWVCKNPYVEQNGVCVCTGNYQILETLGYSQCVCKSIRNYTYYYSANGSCHECGINCTCDITGCVSCFDGSVFIQYEACVCRDRYIFDGLNCLCVDPYEIQIDNVTGAVECKCMNYRIASIYASTNFCSKCPQGCICNSTGCFSCSDPLRVYSNLTATFQVCECRENSGESEGQCACNSFYTYNAATKACECKAAPGLLLFNADSNKCTICPIGCECDQTGCFSCIDQSSRTISTNTQNTKICNCNANFEDVDGVCTCPKGYQKVNNTDCSCEDPYYLDSNSVCTCKAAVNPSGYYYDDFQKKCKACPPGCICNISGCIECGSDFLRTIKYSLKTLKYRCPCLQNTFAVGNYCTVCNKNSYPQYLGNLKNISCVKCVQCLTCNRYGCTSCPQNMTLSGLSCVCNNQSLINLDGVCNCPLQQYLSNNNCQPCPNRCNSCIQRGNTVVCTSCAFDVHRQNLPAEGCPCDDGYKQASEPMKSCCDIKCQKCNSTGCQTCPSFTFRTLVNSQCDCTNGFVEQDSVVCLCPSNSYLLNNECFECPIECLTCGYNQDAQMVKCSSCRQGVNRNSSNDCACDNNYSQTSTFKSAFCYATFCVYEVEYCQECQSPWEIDEEENYCRCTTGYWINSEKMCVKCNLPGCVSCMSQLVCVECNETESYYLVREFCSYVASTEFLAVQTTEQNIIIQYPIDNNILDLETISVSLNPILKPNPTILEEVVNFTVLESKLLKEGTILSVTLQTLNQTYHNVIISFILEWGKNVSHTVGSTLVGDTSTSATDDSLTFNVKMATIYSDKSFDALQAMERVGLYILVIIVIIVSFYFYIGGLKHNQAVFFMQTMSFAGYAILDPQLSTAMFLYNLRYSYYNFSPNNALSNVVPEYYLEESKGNFQYLSVDANIVRNIGIPLILALLVAILSLIFRTVHELTKMKPIIQPAGLSIFWKKKIYRMIEFFYKTLMYPLIFFSIQNLINWNTSVYIHQEFRRKSSILSIIILSVYLLVTLFQYFIELISNFNKIENIKQFLNCVFGSLIIIGSETHPKVMLLLIIIFITTQLPYFRYKIQDLWVYRATNILRGFIIVLEVICTILIVTVSKHALIGMVVVTLIFQMILMVYKELVDKHYNMISKLTSVALNEDISEGSEVKEINTKSEI